MSTARRILENTLVQIFGKVVTAALSIIVLKIISGYLGTAGYGDYTTIYQFLAFFGIAADFGIYTITVKEMSKDTTKIPMILGNVLALRTVLAVVTMALAAIVAFLIPSYSSTVIPMGVLIATLATIFTLLNGTVSSVLQVHLKMQYSTIGLIFGKIISVAYMAMVAYYLFADNPAIGFYHLLWAGVIGNLAQYLLTAFYVHRYTKLTYRFDFGFWKHIFMTSLPYGVALVLNTLYFRIDVILLTILLPHTVTAANGTAQCQAAMCGDTEVGLLGVAMRFLEVLVLIPVYFMNSVLPVMTRFIEEQSKRINELMQYSFDFLIATGLPILVGSFFMAAPIIQFISDPEFLSGNVYEYGADYATKILMFAMMFSFINSLFGFTLVVLNKQVKLMLVNAGCVILNLIGNFAVIPHWGFRGSAIVSVCSEFFILVMTAYLVKKALNLKLSFVTFFKILFSSLIMGAAVWGGLQIIPEKSYLLKIAFLVPFGGAVYIFMILVTRAITPEMWRLMRKS
jgi:O-antigen/teichoic acid export membrane protein